MPSKNGEDYPLSYHKNNCQTCCLYGLRELAAKFAKSMSIYLSLVL